MRTISTAQDPPAFPWCRLSFVLPFGWWEAGGTDMTPSRNLDRITRYQWFESTSLQRRVRCKPDLGVIGSHCVGLDMLIGWLRSEGISVKALNVGSTSGLAAAAEGECDIAAIHLKDLETG